MSLASRTIYLSLSLTNFRKLANTENLSLLRILKMKATITYRFTLTLLLLAIAITVDAQNERVLTREGNKLFEKGNYTDAEANYKKALDKKNNYPEAIFNLGDAIYKQPNRKEEAVTQFELANKLLSDPKLKAQAFHNIGNAYVDAQKYDQAVKAYKEALKLNPKDNDTKYNLAYANEKLRTQNNQDQKKDDQQDKKDDQKQDKKDDKQEQNKEGDNKDQQDNKDEKKENQSQKPKLSKEAAEKLLQALQNEEQKTNEKMQKKEGRPVEVKIEKDW